MVERICQYENVKMIRFKDPYILLPRTESTFPGRFEFVVHDINDPSVLYPSVLNPSLFVEDRIHSSVMTDDVVLAPNEDQETNLLNAVYVSQLLNITDSFIWSLKGGGVLTESCETFDWKKLDALANTWEYLDVFSYRIAAPGSPSSVTGRGFAVNQILIMV